jgi:hypothetical protein
MAERQSREGTNAGIEQLPILLSPHQRFLYPIVASPRRSGFACHLSLSYDSAVGNGPFGSVGSHSIPAINRKTDQRLPQYCDAQEPDVSILLGFEDPVPVLGPDDMRFKAYPGYVIHRRRVEGLFARIERWTRRSDGDNHWRPFSKDVLTLYGKDANSRVANPG